MYKDNDEDFVYEFDKGDLNLFLQDVELSIEHEHLGSYLLNYKNHEYALNVKYDNKKQCYEILFGIESWYDVINEKQTVDINDVFKICEEMIFDLINSKIQGVD